jgi:dGTPase
MALPAPFDDMDLMDRRLFAPAKSGRKHAISMLVGYFIREISLTEDEAFEHPLLSLKASMSPDAYAVLLMIKKFVMNHVIKRPELQHLQYKGQRVIITLFDIFRENPRRLLPEHVFLQYERIGLRAIADYLSAMTDVSAGKLYHKLLSPASGSIYDRP